jgi:hypothetical protein
VAVAVAAPADYRELHEQYRGYVEHILATQGIPPDDVPDAASDIFARFIKLDVLKQFDPEYHIEHKGQKVQANFRTWLTTKVLLYARGQRDKVHRRVSREVLSSQADEGATSWVEVFGGEIWDDYSRMDAQEFVSRMREYLASVPPRSSRDRCDLVALFDMMVHSGWSEGRIVYSDIQEAFHISPTSAYQWVSRLRDVLKAAPDVSLAPAFVQTWNIAGVTLTEADMRQAIDVLKSKAGGIMVKQPLEKAGCKLQFAPQGWYHPFSEYERELYPELEIDPQTHKKPAGHVRKAVVHRLERMLAESAAEGISAEQGSHPEDSFPEPALPADLLEAELWKLGATAEAVDRIIELAQKVFAG